MPTFDVAIVDAAAALPHGRRLAPGASASVATLSGGEPAFSVDAAATQPSAPFTGEAVAALRSIADSLAATAAQQRAALTHFEAMLAGRARVRVRGEGFGWQVASGVFWGGVGLGIIAFMGFVAFGMLALL